eukprot:TRINITY_DN1981_c0_g1_i1.p1 TRINITY_DN1981_c0_g1~~TRINITY_DN1981_c0_g1_i1.p1  ORF type:complete len:738 (+),score=237.46 TRINITY_DN1981_c0_g1_i1:201-2414(+)
MSTKLTHAKLRIQKLENIKRVLDFLTKEGIKLTCSPEDFVDGRLNFIMGFVWSLILAYQIKLGKADLMSWVQTMLSNFNVKVEDFRESWSNGLAFCGLLANKFPEHIDFATLSSDNAHENLERAFSLAETLLGIPRILDPEDLTSGKPDERIILTYVSLFKGKVDLYEEKLASGVVEPPPPPPPPEPEIQPEEILQLKKKVMELEEKLEQKEEEVKIQVVEVEKIKIEKEEQSHLLEQLQKEIEKSAALKLETQEISAVLTQKDEEVAKLKKKLEKVETEKVTLEVQVSKIQELEELVKRIPLLEAEVQAAADLRDKAVLLEQREKELQKLRSENQRLKELSSKSGEVNEELMLLRELLETRNEELADLNVKYAALLQKSAYEVAYLVESHKQLTDQLEDAKRKNQLMLNKIAEIKKNILEAKERGEGDESENLKNLQNELAQLKEQNEKLKKELVEMAEKAEEANKKAKALSTWLENAKQENRKTGEKNLISKAALEVADLINEQEAMKQRLQVAEENFENVSNYLSNLNDELRIVKNNNERLVKKIKALAEELKNYQNLHTLERANELFSQTKKKYEGVKKKYETLKQEHKWLQDDYQAEQKKVERLFSSLNLPADYFETLDKMEKEGQQHKKGFLKKLFSAGNMGKVEGASTKEKSSSGSTTPTAQGAQLGDDLPPSTPTSSKDRTHRKTISSVPNQSDSLPELKIPVESRRTEKMSRRKEPEDKEKEKTNEAP